MRKFMALFSIILLLLSQIFPSMTSVSAAADEGKGGFKIIPINGSTQEKATINIHSSSEYDQVHLILPENVVYDEDMTKNLEQHVDITYKEKAHSIILEWKKHSKQEATIVLIDLPKPNNEMIVQGIVAEEVIIEELHTFNVGVDHLDKEKENQEVNEENVSEEIRNTKKDDESDEFELVDKEEGKAKENINKQKDEKQNEEEMITPFVGDLNTDIDVSPVRDKVLSGENVQYKLSLKLTGAKRIYKDVDLIIDLPVSEHVTFDDSKLDKLSIDGVIPTYDTDSHQLMYHFEEIKRGQTYEKIIPLETANGYITDGTELPVHAVVSGEIHLTERDEKEKLEEPEVEQFEFEDETKVVIEATSGVSITKSVISPQGEVAEHGDEVTWQLEVNIPKKNKGQIFLKPDEPIQITDHLPEELTFEGMEDGLDPNQDGKTLTWEFPVDSLEEQEISDGTLFSKKLTFTTSVNHNAPEHDYITNNANSEGAFIDNNTIRDETEKRVYISGDLPGAGEIEGNVPLPVHIGPSNGEGGLGTNDNKNPHPQVTDDALLTFNYGIAPLRESRPSSEILEDGRMKLGDEFKDFEEYRSLYQIDANLNLETLRTPTGFKFKPTNSVEGIPFPNQPQYAIQAKVNGNLETLVESDMVVNGKTYTREELGLSLNDQVSEVRLNFTYAPAGMQADSRVQLGFSVNPGYTGEVLNSFNIEGIDGLGQPFSLKERHEEQFELGSDRDIAGPRQATINPYPEEPEPVGEVGVRLLEHEGGLVELGDNRMKLNLANVKNSKAPMTERLESVVLLPPGVQLKDDVNDSYTDARGNKTDNASYELLTADYNGSGRQLVKVIWNDERITKGQELTAELDVVIDEHAPSQLPFDVYGFSGDEELGAPEYSDNLVTNTILQTDEEDLNGNGNTEQPRLKSGNLYVLVGDHHLQTEKLIKGPGDENYSKFTTAKPEETVDYKLTMTNTTGKDIATMTLIDVLPSIGDLGITDNIGRGSMFEPILNGPISISEDWEDKVKVFYSTTKNPERDDLTRHTIYPDTTEKLTNPDSAENPNWMEESEVSAWEEIHSIKVELVDDGNWIAGQDMEIDFSMVIPKQDDLNEDALDADVNPAQRAAWNSFAVATNDSQPVEPERVGVAVELDPPKTPNVEKEVENNEGEFVKDLVKKERQQEYRYQINTTIPEDLNGYETIALADELDDRLDVLDAIALVDGQEVDYEVDIDGQLVGLNLEREQLNEIAGKKLTLQIIAQIKPGVSVEVIDNEATIQVNDNPSEKSNIVSVKPVEIASTVSNTLDDSGSKLPKTSTDIYNYILLGFFLFVLGLGALLGKKNGVKNKV